MEKFLFVLTRGLEDPVRVTRTLQLAKVAKEKGCEVHLFLTDDAVFLAKRGMVQNIKAPTGDEAGPYFSFLVEKGVPIYVWIPCAKNRQVGEGDVVETAKFAGAPLLIDLSKDSKVFTFWFSPGARTASGRLYDVAGP
jgi:predicted peroxiredoxin